MAALGKFNAVGRVLGRKTYNKLDPLMSHVETSLTPEMPQTPDLPGSPYVDQGQIDRQARDLARKRKGVAANQLAGDAGGGMVASPTLGGN